MAAETATDSRVCLRVRTHYLPGTYNTVPDHWFAGMDGEILTFSDEDKATDFIHNEYACRYDLSHGEYDRPTYEIVPVAKAPRKKKFLDYDVYWEVLESL